jgi:23S rRNA pseudouridine1911/1915/1917 synthase
MILDEVTILYEDEDVLAINKPSGLIVHSDGKTEEPSLVDWILKERPEIAGVGEPIVQKDGSTIDRPGIVHRIDRDTSGVLLIAKTQESFIYLKEKFKERDVKKVYVAFTHGAPREMRGILRRDIKRSKTDFRKFTAYAGRGTARPAETHFRVINHTKGVAYVEMRPKTGRTHQLRVHFASIGHPILGDTLYGSGREEKLGMKRLALHALSISYEKENGDTVLAESPLPEDFKIAVKELESIAK